MERQAAVGVDSSEIDPGAVTVPTVGIPVWASPACLDDAGRRLLTPDIHGGPAERNRGEDDWLLAPGTSLFRRHGIHRITPVVTDNGANYRAKNFTRSIQATAARHQRIRPHTPKHNGKVERYNRTLAEEVLYARDWISETPRATAITTWNIHYNYHRVHTAIGNQPPAARLHHRLINVMT